MPTVKVNEQELFFTRTKGSEPELLLLHGAGGSHLDWPAGLRRLPQTAVSALDLPGHGRSPGPGCNSISDYANFVVAFMRQQKMKNVIVAGHSMGGAVALEVALRTETAVAGLVLLATGARLPVSDAILDQALHDFDAATSFITRHAWAAHVPDEVRRLGLTRLRHTRPEVLHADFVACNTFDARDRLHEVGVPALVIGAALDKMAPPRFSRFLAAQIPHAELLLLEETGHMVTLERETAVVAAVQAFIQRIAT